MPKSKTAVKSARSSRRKAERNKSVKSATKTYITKAEKLIEKKEIEAATPAVKTAISSLDKAAKKKIIHPNTAARRKSRLMKKLNQAAKPSVAKAEKTKTRRAKKQ